MKKEKQPYTVQFESEKEVQIRTQISKIKKETGMSKKRIATEYMLAGIESKKNFNQSVA